jgi:hypothetical protein
MEQRLIAPCGMNCGICLGYLREKNRCPGCRNLENKKEYLRKCIIRNCEKLRECNKKYCGRWCDKYPCRRLKALDKRYRTRYGMSMVENLENIEKEGIREFVKSEKEKWKCRKCGEVICVHRKVCLKCGTVRVI